MARGDGKAVGCSIVESFGKDVTPRELEDVLRLEYRSKLLNPKWAKAMAAQGSGGAYEISQRMTAAVGKATASTTEDRRLCRQDPSVFRTHDSRMPCAC